MAGGVCTPLPAEQGGEQPDGEGCKHRQGTSRQPSLSQAVGGSWGGSGAGASAPSVSCCPTSIPHPLALILSPPHVGQRQKQSRDNLSVPPAEPRPCPRNGPRRSAVGHRPCPTTVAVGVSPRPPAPHGSGGFAGSSGPVPPSAAPGCHVWWASSTGGHRCTPHPREPRHSAGGVGTCRGSREMTGALSESPAQLSRSCSQN